MERVGDRGKNGRILLNRPKPTAGCSASGRRSTARIIRTDGRILREEKHERIER
jgi:hypothetical protein